MDGGVPHGERAIGIVLPDPGVQGVEGWQAKAVAIRRQHEAMAEERGWRFMRGVPLCLERDVFDGDKIQTPVLLWLVDEGLWLEWVDLGGTDEIAIDVVDSHGADAGVVDAGDALRVLEYPVLVRCGDGERVIAGGGGADIAKGHAAIAMIGADHPGGERQNGD